MVDALSSSNGRLSGPARAGPPSPATLDPSPAGHQGRERRGPRARREPRRLHGDGALGSSGCSQYYSAATISRMSAAASLGVLPTFTPAASRASCLACAVPAEPDTMAPAWPMVLPSGAVKPAT